MHPTLHALHEQLRPDRLFAESEWGLGWIVSESKGHLELQRDDAFYGEPHWFEDADFHGVALADFAAARGLYFGDFGDHFDDRVSQEHYPGLMAAAAGLKVVYDGAATIGYADDAGDVEKRTLDVSVMAHVLGWYGRYGGAPVEREVVDLGNLNTYGFSHQTKRGVVLQAANVSFVVWHIAEDLEEYGPGGVVHVARYLARVPTNWLRPNDEHSFICVGESLPLDLPDQLARITEQVPGHWVGFVSPAFVRNLEITKDT